MYWPHLLRGLWSSGTLLVDEKKYSILKRMLNDRRGKDTKSDFRQSCVEIVCERRRRRRRERISLK